MSDKEFSPKSEYMRIMTRASLIMAIALYMYLHSSTQEINCVNDDISENFALCQLDDDNLEIRTVQGAFEFDNPDCFENIYIDDKRTRINEYDELIVSIKHVYTDGSNKDFFIKADVYEGVKSDPDCD